MKFIRFFTSVFRFTLILQKRYFFDVAAGLVNLLLFLVFIQLGIHTFQGYVDGALIGQKLSMLIIGFFSFMVVSNSISVVAYGIVEGASTGTLEQAMLSPFGAEGLFLGVAASRSIINLIIAGILIPVSMLICSHWFSIDIYSFILLIIPMWICCWGIGFMFGAFALVFKRIGSFLNLAQFIILSLMVLPSYPFSWYSLLPVSPQVVTMTKVCGVGGPLSLSWLSYLYVHGALYLLLGILIFKKGEDYAKRKGILGQY
ncbi:MAG: ABC transporter permease [Pseudomonadota bacterium]